MTPRIFRSTDQKVTVALDPSLFDDDEPGFRRRAMQWLKRLAAVVFLLLLAWAVCGTPYLRWDEPLVDGKDGADLQEKDLAFTRYVSIGDARRVHAGDYGQGLPWLIFIPHRDRGRDEAQRVEFSSAPGEAQETTSDPGLNRDVGEALP